MVTIAVILGIVGILPGIGWLVSPIVSVLACILGGKHIRAVNAGVVEGGKGGAIAGVVLGVLGLLQAVVAWLAVLVMVVAFVPMICASNLSTQTNAMAVKGRNLFVSILHANTERAATGLPPLWPTSENTRSDDLDDIAGRSFSSAEGYFTELFDLSNYGTKDWSPYVAADVGVICTSTRLKKRLEKGLRSLSSSEVDWLVVKGLTDDVPDCVPVLVSANVNPACLVISGSFDGMSNSPVLLGRAHGAPKDMFDNKAFVVVYKSGAVCVFKVKYATLANLYHHEGFTLPFRVMLEYLAPGSSF